MRIIRPMKRNDTHYPVTRPVRQLYRPAATLRMRPRSRGNYVQECNHVYAEAHGAGLVMDIFKPEGAPNGLAIIDVVGGGWYSDRVQLNEHIGLGVYDVLCEAGFTVFAVCTGSVTRFTGFEMIRHVREAIRYIRHHAAGFGIDASRLGLTGSSAGGHIAALAALKPKSAIPSSRDPYKHYDTHVQAVGLFFPPTDLIDFKGEGIDFTVAEGTPIERLFHPPDEAISHAEMRARQEILSPARQVRTDPPPFLLLHGDADTVVPLEQSERLRDALLAAGGEAELVIKPGGGHPWRDIQTEITQMMVWFKEHLAE